MGACRCGAPGLNVTRFAVQLARKDDKGPAPTPSRDVEGKDVIQV